MFEYGSFAHNLLEDSMKKHATLAAAAALAVLAQAPGLAQAQEVVRIAHAAAVSGPVAYFGKDDENGARMAIEDLNARGTTIAGKKVVFQLVAEDDAGEPKQATAVAQKLVDARINGVIGHETSGTTIPASKIYHDAGVPQISASATSPLYTLQGYDTTFRVVGNDTQLGHALGRYVGTTLGAKRIAVIDDRTAYGQGLVAEFSKSLNGATVVDREFTNDKASDFSSILTKIKSTHPDVIFFGGMSAVAGPMLRQMRQLGMTMKLVGGDGICSDEIAKLAQGAMADGQVVCAEAGGIEASGQPAIDKFKAAYKKRFGIDVQIYAPYVYDAVMAMAQAMVKAGSAAPAKYLPELAKIHYQGLTGTIAFDAHGDLRDAALTLYTFQGGHRKTIAVMR
jgi:branched-chain amino acid transport system substrate-binding protein